MCVCVLCKYLLINTRSLGSGSCNSSTPEAEEVAGGLLSSRPEWCQNSPLWCHIFYCGVKVLDCGLTVLQCGVTVLHCVVQCFVVLSQCSTVVSHTPLWSHNAVL